MNVWFSRASVALRERVRIRLDFGFGVGVCVWSCCNFCRKFWASISAKAFLDSLDSMAF